MIREWARRLRRYLLGTRVPEGDLGVKVLGHRRYVGGRWEEMGRLQLDYMIAAGLEPRNVFLDIACGSLRGGRHFIRYLEPGHYLGLEKEESLVRAGLEKEMDPGVVAAKRPEIVVSEAFEFEAFSKVPELSLANSLFTHLREEDIRFCLQRLRDFVGSGHHFHATFFEGSPDDNPEDSHDHGHFRHPRETMVTLGEATGWRGVYVGEWGHPRDQVMMRYEAR